MGKERLGPKVSCSGGKPFRVNTLSEQSVKVFANRSGNLPVSSSLFKFVLSTERMYCKANKHGVQEALLKDALHGQVRNIHPLQIALPKSGGHTIPFLLTASFLRA